MEKILKIIDFKTPQDYGKIWELQKKLVEERIKDNISDHLLLLEHKHVITTGNMRISKTSNYHRKNSAK